MSYLDDVFDSDLATMGMRLEPDERSDDVVHAIAEYLQDQPHIISRFFKFPGAPQQAVHNFYRTIKLVSVKRSTLLCRQGEIGTCFYIIKRGSAEVLHHPVRMVSAVHARVGVGGSTGAIVVSSSDRSRLGCRVGVLTPGMVFGEVSACGEERDSSVVALGALVASAPDMDAGGWQSAPDSLHLASAHAVGETELFQIDLNAYSRCAPATLVKAEAALRRRVERLMVLDLFSDWPTQELGFFARWMTELALPEAGEVLYAEGEPVDTVFFVLEGSVGLQCQHPTNPRAVLHLHHVNAPSFCGEDEVMNGIEERVHTCVSVTANTTVAMLPARVFQVLITSQFPARMYKSAEKLRHLREARTDWYDIRMSLGDSAAVPFGFLDHSQSKLLPNEIHEGVVTRERKITNLFQRVLSGEDGPLATARRTARGMQAGAGGAGGAGAGASGSQRGGAAPATPRRPLSARRASMSTMLLGSAPPPAAQPEAARSLPRTSSAQKLQDGTRDDDPPELSSYDRFYSGTYHPPSTPDQSAAVLRPQAAPPVPPLNLIGTPRVGGEDRPASPMDWNKPKMSEAEFERQRTKETVAVELTAVMKAVNQFKRLLGRRRARQARKKAAQAAQAHHSPHASPHGARDSPVSGTLERAPGGDGARVRRTRGHHRTRSSDDRRRTSGTTTLPAAAGSAARKASYSRSSSLGDPTSGGGQSAKELARTGSMGSALSAASGPRVGSGFGLRQTKSMHAMPSRRSSRVPRRLPSIEDNQPPLAAVPVDSPTSVGSGGSGDTPTSRGSASSRTSGRRRSSTRTLARASANKPEPLHRQLLRARASVSVAGQSPTGSDGSPLPATPERRASGTAFRRINDTDRALSPAAMRARNASARRRSSGGSEDSARAAAAAVARTEDMRRSWSPARGGPARDLGQSTPEDERRRASLAVALGSEAQAQLRNPTPGSPASKLPERARRASFASMQRRSSVSSISEANLP